MNTRLIFLSLSASLAAGLAAVPLCAAAEGVRVCTFPGSPTAALDTAVAREVFRVAGVAANFNGKGLKGGDDDDGVSAHELARSLQHSCDVIAGFPVSGTADGSDSHMLFSQGYLRSGYVSITARGASQAATGQQTIAATYSSPSQLIAVQQAHAHFDLENTSEATVDAVAQGRAQRAIVWYPAVVAYEQAHPSKRFDVSATVSSYSDWSLVFAFSGNDTSLQQRVDGALGKLQSSGRLVALTRDWALPGNLTAALSVSKPRLRAISGAVRLAAYQPSMGGFIKVSESTAADQVPAFDSEQVAHGKALYADSCAKCHGDKLEGNVAPALSGPSFAPAANAHITVGGIYQYMASNMPADKPGQMKDGDYADLMAYLLYANGYDASKAHLGAATASASTAPLNAGPRQ
jgi:polar amino acid transport system substrate-binding protein